MAIAPPGTATYSPLMLSIIIPTLNAAPVIEPTVSALNTSEFPIQVILCDGGSHDETSTIAGRLGATVIKSPPGRGSQLSAGARAATHPWLLFLHADTMLQPTWATDVKAFIDSPQATQRAAVFKFALDDRTSAARRLERLVAWRCKFLGLPYGDQGLLISRQFYDRIGGFAELPLFEDVDIIRRIGRRNIDYLDTTALTSAIRYQKNGYVLRSLRNATCLMLYFAGLSPKLIGRLYQ